MGRSNDDLYLLLYAIVTSDTERSKAGRELMISLGGILAMYLRQQHDTSIVIIP
jgi:hypothetical protein